MIHEFLGEPKQMFVVNYMTQMVRMAENLAWFSLRDNVANMLLAKFLLNDDNESMRIFERYNVCHRVVLNQELIYDHITVNRLLELCPTDEWRQIIELEFENYEANDPQNNRLDLLKELKRETFFAFRACRGFENFRTEVVGRTSRIASLLGEVYDEINGIQ